MTIEILKVDEQKFSSRGMEKLSQEDQRKILRSVELQEGAAVGEAEHVGGDDEKEKPKDRNLCMKDGKSDKTSRQEAFEKLEMISIPIPSPLKSDTKQNETRELIRCVDEINSKKHNVELFDRKNNVVEVITERDSDRKTVQDMTRNITVRDQVLNIDRKQKLNLSLVELDRHVDRKPPTGSVVDNLDLDDMIIVRDTQAETQTFAKLKPRTVIRANQAQDDCWEEGSRKMKQEEAGREEEEEE